MQPTPDRSWNGGQTQVITIREPNRTIDYNNQNSHSLAMKQTLEVQQNPRKLQNIRKSRYYNNKNPQGQTLSNFGDDLSKNFKGPHLKTNALVNQ